jgi:hypothetical protein
MKGCFWNGDGFGDLAKHAFVRETIREHKLDFLQFYKLEDLAFQFLS